MRNLIFRPGGEHLISMRKALDMDYELGDRIEYTREEEIRQVFDEVQPVEKHRLTEGVVVVSIDATKVREKQGVRTPTRCPTSSSVRSVKSRAAFQSPISNYTSMFSAIATFSQ